MSESTIATDPRRKLAAFTKAVVNSKQMQEGGGMLGSMLVSMLPMVSTMLERASPETVAGFSSLLARAFGAIADPECSDEQFGEQLAMWTSPE